MGDEGAVQAHRAGHIVNPEALIWAKIRSGGPLQAAVGSPMPTSVRRLVTPSGEAVWLLPNDLASGHDILAEHGLSRRSSDTPNESARVLACCLRCCWPSSQTSLWPGVPAPIDAVASVYARLKDIDDLTVARSRMTAALRQLVTGFWVLMDNEGDSVRLGPFVGTWGDGQVARLRRICDNMPAPTSAGEQESG